MLKTISFFSVGALLLLGCGKPAAMPAASAESAVLALSAFYSGELTPAADPNLRGVVSTSATDGGFIAPPSAVGPGSDQGVVPAPGSGPVASNPVPGPGAPAAGPASGSAPGVVPAPAPVAGSSAPGSSVPSSPGTVGSSTPPVSGSNPAPGGTDGGTISPPAPGGSQPDSGAIATNPPAVSPVGPEPSPIVQNPPTGGTTPIVQNPPTGGTTPPSGPIAQNPPIGGTTSPGGPIAQTPPTGGSAQPPTSGSDGGTIAPPAPGGSQPDSGAVATNPPAIPPAGPQPSPIVQNPPTGGTAPIAQNPPSGGTTPPGGPIAQNPPAGGPAQPPAPGSDGGTIGQNPPKNPPQDGGSVCVPGKDCISIEVEMNRVCSARRSLISFPEFVFFEEARRPLLTFESDVSACVRAPNSRSLASMTGNLPHPVESQLVRILLGAASSNPRTYVFGSQGLGQVDLLKGKYRTRLAFNLNQIRTWFPQSWSNLYVNARVCDDTNQDGLCEGEKVSNQLLAQASGFRLSRIPSKIGLLVWNGRSRTLKEDPRLCEMQISPLVLDLNGDGLKFSSAEEGVVFDLDGNGEPVLTAWATAVDDALLVRDLDRNGRIDSGKELFGSATILKNGLKARNGFLALADLDSNANGLFDRGDREWSELKLWSDRNQDGISDPEELIGLNRVNLVSIDLGYVDSAEIDPHGNETRQRSTYQLRSSAGKIFIRQVIDIWFSTLKLQ
jgi:hypothetical protein